MRERPIIVPWLVWAVVIGFAVAAALYPALTAAQQKPPDVFVMEDANGKLTLTPKPCPLGPWFAKWKAARWFYHGKDYEACWVIQDRQVVVIDSIGAVSAIPPHAFRPEEGI